MKKHILIALCIIASIGSGHAQFAGASSASYRLETSTNYEGSVTRGYKGYIELGTSLGSGYWSMYGTGALYTSHGFLFNPYFYLGAGIGFEGGATGGDGIIALPMFVELRTHIVNPNKRRHVPFIGVRGGVSPVDEDTRGGYFNLFLGYRFKPQHMKKTAFNLSIGYQMQQYGVEHVHYYYDYNYNYYEYDYDYDRDPSHAFSFRMGFEF